MALLLVATGCSSSDDGTEGVSSGPPVWQGEAPHFLAQGTLSGEAIDIRIVEPDAADTSKLWCEREYVVPAPGGIPNYAEGELVELKLDGFAAVAGETRRFEIEFKKHDFQSDVPGTSVRIVPRDDTADPAPGEMWLEWEWYDATDAELLAVAATEGNFKLERYTGTPDSTGLVIPSGEGMIAGHVVARWSPTEEVKLSFTAHCAESAVEQVQ